MDWMLSHCKSRKASGSKCLRMTMKRSSILAFPSNSSSEEKVR